MSALTNCSVIMSIGVDIAVRRSLCVWVALSLSRLRSLNYGDGHDR